MASWLKSVKAELRAVLCGWLAVALIIPALLGTAAGQPLSPAEALYHQIEQANCIQSGQTVPDQDQHKVHDHDCCLPNVAAAPLLDVAAPDVDVIVPAARFAEVETIAWSTPAHHPHHTQLGFPRGPPSFLI